MLVSARNSGRAFDLRCEVRETMIAWLQQAHPHALPRWRGELQPADVEAQEIVLRRAVGGRG
jgi:hypothetical protein